MMELLELIRGDQYGVYVLLAAFWRFDRRLAVLETNLNLLKNRSINSGQLH